MWDRLDLKVVKEYPDLRETLEIKEFKDLLAHLVVQLDLKEIKVFPDLRGIKVMLVQLVPKVV